MKPEDINLSELPQIDEYTLRYFEKLFPDMAGYPNDDAATLHRRVGSALVIRKMREIYKSREEGD